MTEVTCPHLDDIPAEDRPGPQGTRPADPDCWPPAPPAEVAAGPCPLPDTYDGSLALLAAWG